MVPDDGLPTLRLLSPSPLPSEFRPNQCRLFYPGLNRNDPGTPIDSPSGLYRNDTGTSVDIKAGLCLKNPGTAVHLPPSLYPKDIDIPPALGHDRCYHWLHALRAKKDSESSDDSTCSYPLPLPTPPDSGWGWVVVLGAFLVLMICDGIAYSFGVLYTELLTEFDTTRTIASLVGSTFFGVSLILGPLGSSLTTRFGCRKMTIFGGVLSSTGFLLSYFVDSIELLCLTFSVVIGAGFSFCYITSVVIVAFYFEKRRALATGLSVCGTGVGTFTFAPLMNYLIDEYGLKGQFLILSGICLNLVLCGMLFRPLKFTGEERRRLMLESFERMSHGQEEIEVMRSRHQSEEVDTDSETESSEDDIKSLSTLNLPTFCAKSQFQISNELLTEAVKNSKNPHRTMQRYIKNAVMRSEQTNLNSKPLNTQPHNPKNILTKSTNSPKSDQNALHISKVPASFESRGTSVYIGKHPALAIQLPLYRSDIFYRPHQKQNNKLAPCTLSTSCPELIDSGNADQDNIFSQRLKTFCEEISDVLTNMIDRQLLRNRFFIILLISNFIFYMWSDIPYMYAVDHATNEGIDHQRSSFLVSIIGIANTVGQVFFGYLGDLDVNALNIYAVVSIMAGGAVAMVPFSSTYWVASLLYALFGFFVSVGSPLTTVLLVTHLGIEKLTSAYGLLMLVQGVANLVGPPLAGWVSDMMESYEPAYYLSGLFHAVSGLALFLVYLQRRAPPPSYLVTSQTRVTGQSV